MSGVFGAGSHVESMLSHAAGVNMHSLLDLAVQGLRGPPSSRRGSLDRAGLATSLAGALPGCVSETLTQYLQVYGAGAGGSGVQAAAGGDACAVCMVEPCAAVLAGCGHSLCFTCAGCIVGQGVGLRPPLCPFCRAAIRGFTLRVSVPA
jgi:hypothetical protein